MYVISCNFLCFNTYVFNVDCDSSMCNNGTCVAEGKCECTHIKYDPQTNCSTCSSGYSNYPSCIGLSYQKILYILYYKSNYLIANLCSPGFMFYNNSCIGMFFIFSQILLLC